MFTTGCRIAAPVLALVYLPLQPAAGQTAPSSVPVPESQPYRYASLRELPNEQIVRYMGQGRMMWELEQQAIPKTTTPPGFWSVPAKAAALSLADVNRTPRHRERYRLAIDDGDGLAPPKACTIAYSALPRHGWAGDELYVLFASPEGSWLAYTRTNPDRGSFDPVLAQTRCDVRFCELEYETARHVADVIWWLNRLRTYGDLRTMSGSPTYFYLGSSADARGALVATVGEETVVEVLDRIWYMGVPYTWSGEYRPSVLLNLTGHLMTSALPEHLGGKGLGEEMKHPSDRLPPPEPGARVKLDYVKPETDRIHHAVGRILEQVAQNPERIPWPIAREAALAAGDLAFTDHAPLLRRVQAAVGRPAGAVRTRREVEGEVRQAAMQALGLQRDRPSGADGDHLMRLGRLAGESNQIRHGLNAQAGRADVREAATESLGKIDIAGNSEELYARAASDHPWSQWAVSRLRKVDPKRCAAALEWRLGNLKHQPQKHILEAIAEMDPPRGRRLAANPPEAPAPGPPPGESPLVTDALAVADPAKRADGLIRVALDPGNHWMGRGDAIRHLVPADDPMKYPSDRIDRALLKLLDPALADKTVNFTMARACEALARRGRVEHFDAIAACLDHAAAGNVYPRVLGSLTVLAQLGADEHRARLASILKPHLQRTNQRMGEIVWCVWAADLRQFKGDLERIATSGPEQYEGRPAYTSRGTPSGVAGRYHLARQVAAMWNEQDPVTRARLLLAFYFRYDYYMYADVADSKGRRVRAELAELVKGLSRSQRREAVDFLKWYERTYDASGWLAMEVARSVLGLPPSTPPGRGGQSTQPAGA